jgi:hypothetical protein
MMRSAETIRTETSLDQIKQIVADSLVIIAASRRRLEKLAKVTDEPTAALAKIGNKSA